jgi:hypothetical protein
MPANIDFAQARCFPIAQKVNKKVIARRGFACLTAGPLVALAAGPALAIDQVHDEIQVYNAEIAEIGQ